MPYDYDLIVIGGGPAGYAASIRAGQLKKRVLCIEKENLGGTCLNWGCIPTKALLENGALVRKLREHGEQWGVSCKDLKIDFAKIIARSRGIAEKLAKGIGFLFKKYNVAHEIGTATLLGEHRVHLAGKTQNRDLSAQYIILATGARAKSLPGIELDGKTILTAREAMTLAQQPQRLAIIGAGAIGCEFADFYNAIGTKVTIIEMMPHLLPLEEEETAAVLERSFIKRGIDIHTNCKTEKVQKTDQGVVLTVSGPGTTPTIEADMVLMAVGVTGNVENLADEKAKLELIKNHVKVDGDYRTSVPEVYAVGDVIGPPWLAHVAHHEAINCVEKIFGLHPHAINYQRIPGCTYTHPQVASMGKTQKKCQEENLKFKVGKFPLSASGRALAAGEPDGFVKLIFSEPHGELLGVHMVGENVTELLGELVVAQNLEATEEEILQAMHPHPTMSEAIMEAAGASVGKAIHI